MKTIIKRPLQILLLSTFLLLAFFLNSALAQDVQDFPRCFQSGASSAGQGATAYREVWCGGGTEQALANTFGITYENGKCYLVNDALAAPLERACNGLTSITPPTCIQKSTDGTNIQSITCSNLESTSSGGFSVSNGECATVEVFGATQVAAFQNHTKVNCQFLLAVLEVGGDFGFTGSVGSPAADNAALNDPANNPFSDLGSSEPRERIDQVPIQQTTPSGQPRGNTDPDCTNASKVEDNCIVKRLIQIVNFLSAGVGIVITIIIVVAGFQYIASNGNPQTTAAAKSKIFHAIIALLMYLFMFAILQWLIPGGIFG